MSIDEINILCDSLIDISNFEFWTMSPKDLGVYFRAYSKKIGQNILIDHRFLNNLMDQYEKDGLDSEMLVSNPSLIDFVDAFYEKMHSAKLEFHEKLDQSKTMPDVTKRLQQLQNHWEHKSTWNSTLPVKPINQLTINAIKLEMPKLTGVSLVSSEEEALALESEILKKYGQYIEFESVSTSSE